MRDASAFDASAFLGLARNAKRDPYRFGLFARHLESDETPRAFVTIHGGTLIVTDRRVIEFRPHLETHGAWNVKSFVGYEIARSLDRDSLADVVHDIRTAADGRGGVEDRIVLSTPDGREDILVSKGPEPTLRPGEFDTLRQAILGPQA